MSSHNYGLFGWRRLKSIFEAKPLKSEVYIIIFKNLVSASRNEPRLSFTDLLVNTLQGG
jgi:hypothetical protein